MRCARSEDDLALYVEGDLLEAKARELEKHLEECATCRAVVAELRESQAVFKSLREEVVSSAALAEVRNRVMAEVAAARGKVPWGRWLWALAGVACVVMLALYSLPRRGGEDAPSEAKAQTGWSARPEHFAELTTPAPDGAIPPLRGGESKRRQQPKQAVMKLMTDDPDVVIYWLLDENGG
jgi:anti-sigma factor RsiW